MEFVSCLQCPLRALPVFSEQAAGDAALIESLKKEQIVVRADDFIVREGQVDAPLYTLLQGWALRTRMLDDGRRQILNFLLPGDFIGVQRHMGQPTKFDVVALSDVVLCVFRRDVLWELSRTSPPLGFGVTWLAAHEESIVDDPPPAIGRRSAEERIAVLLVMMFKRVAALRAGDGLPGVPFPVTPQHIADVLGLSLAHTHRTLRKLETRGLHRAENGRLELLDVRVLPRLAELYGDGRAAARPLV